ncbi:2OG-Fe(II) oxygenase [Aestuariibacter sp. AA17]|uniref:2OG-Fe(II) oxygenase n=1 Tax=Fluctibacter corallii TaxID=2984329 RepID=A0ABT3A6R7_9ALTE|nr:2OG-Fe(II) oxygenase [Aestuariibacter sp. AA17]MCV2884293.1 2OG-Fe(II) oxygenase [Aestuariibacter sp. AA17]
MITCKETDDIQRFLENAVDAIHSQGYFIAPHSLPQPIAQALLDEVQALQQSHFHEASIGRETDNTQNKTIRRDQIHWFNGQTQAEAIWLDWTSNIQTAMNRYLYMGLFSFEGHYAHYRQGDFYKKHVDAFRGKSNRKLTLINYLNKSWSQDDGGEMILYLPNNQSVSIAPEFATTVLFLSEDFPHEVLPSKRDRYSVTGWFRINESGHI